ncbi:MAG: glycosyltransferase [Myxococcota bacterium]
MPAQRRSVIHARISVVVPVYNEEAVLPELRDRLRAVLEASTSAFEVILVDDGSTDGTPELIAQMNQEDGRFCSIHLSRNFGHQAAVTAGLHYASGDIVVVMDADLQDPPEVLPLLLQEWEKGSDIVYAVRENRKENFIKVALYNLFYRILGHLSVVAMPLDAGDFCLLSRVALDEINRLPEKQREVVMGVHVYGKTYQQVVEETGIPLGSLKRHLRQGLSRLRANLATTLGNG